MKKTIRASLRVGTLLLVLLLVGQPTHAQTLARASQLLTKESGKAQPARQKLRGILNDLKTRYRVDILFEGGLVENVVVSTDLLDYKASLEENLDKILRAANLNYKKVKSGTYVILANKKTAENSTLGDFDAPSMATVERLPQAEVSPLVSPARVETIAQMVRGKVVEENGGGLPGVSVLLKGTQRGTTSDASGAFQVEVADAASVLVFSYVGYQSQEVTVGNRTNLTVSLVPESKALQEVVVTALGIKKQAKSLGYATATVSPEEMTINRTANFMNALQGKMAGVNITPLGSGPAGTSKIRIRGQSSFGGNNSPLIVVNGVPIDNTNNGARGDVSERGSNRTSDGGDGLSSINPDDIENLTVLKGAAASALYGSRAKDGVIMITTKTRGSGSGVSLSYNSNYTSETALDYTDYQYEYGQGGKRKTPDHCVSYLRSVEFWRKVSARYDPDSVR